MRNYNSKTHVKPLTQHSFRKDERTYPSQQRFSRSIAKINSKQQQKAQKTICCQGKIKSEMVFPVRNSILPIPNHQSKHVKERYYLNLQNPFSYKDRHSNILVQDPFCLWYKQIQLMPSQNKQRLITIKKVTYTITDWAQDLYPQVLFVTMQGVYGYLNQTSIPTNRVVTMRLKTIVPVIRNNVQVNDLIYESCSDISWQVPTSLTYIKLGIKDQTSTQIQLPLPNPITLQLQITNEQIL